MVTRLFKICVLIALLVFPALSMAVTLEAVADRTTVNLEESFTLQLRGTGVSGGDPDLSVLEKDFELLGRSESSQIQYTNGELKRGVVWTLNLMARSAGPRTIPALCIDDQCSAPVALTVLPAGASSSDPASGSELLLEVSALPQALPVQSELIYQVRLLTRVNFVQASLSEPKPTGVEVAVQKLGEDSNSETRVNGLLYRVIERKYAIFPQQSGQLTIPALRFDAQISAGRQGGVDLFNRRTRQIRKYSQALTIEVSAAEDSSGRSWLPARRLLLSDDWQDKKPQLTVGEPLTRTLTLRANGLPAAQFPPLNMGIPAGVKSYPDKPVREDQFDAEGTIGLMQQKVALVPTRPGPLLLPEITIDWWDTGAKSWRQAKVPAIEVEVLPASKQPPVAAGSPGQAAEKKQLQEKTALPTPVRIITDPGFWPWLSAGLAIGWLVTLGLLLKGRFGRRRGPDPLAQKSATSRLPQARKELHRQVTSGDNGSLRRAFIDWGAALYPEEKPQNLEQLAILCGAPLAQQLEGLNRCLYSPADIGRDQQALLNGIEQAEKALEKQKSSQLPPFYPH